MPSQKYDIIRILAAPKAASTKESKFMTKDKRRQQKDLY